MPWDKGCGGMTLSYERCTPEIKFEYTTAKDTVASCTLLSEDKVIWQ